MLIPHYPRKDTVPRSLSPLAPPQAKAVNVYGSPSSGGRSPYSSCCSCLVGSNPETLWWNADCILSIATDMNDLTEPGLNAPVINCLVISCFSDFVDKFLQQGTLGTVWSGLWSVNFSISSFVIPVSFVIEPDSITRFSPCGRPGVSGMCQQSVLFYPHFVTEPVSIMLVC